jgi:hypothetical protein
MQVRRRDDAAPARREMLSAGFPGGSVHSAQVFSRRSILPTGNLATRMPVATPRHAPMLKGMF